MKINSGLTALAMLVLLLADTGAVRAQITGPPAPAAGAPTVRPPDAFYLPPANLPQKPGTLLRSEAMRDVTLPAGMRAWRILYTTTTNDNKTVAAVATIFGPAGGFTGPRPVILWEHGTTGVMQRCMPSLVSQPALGIPALAQAAAAGWVIVATDYPTAGKDGPIPYLVGEGEARAGLDSVRAARQVPGLALDSRTVVCGHSQGGHAALWTGIIGPRYAPDVSIAGVAALAPAANITRLLALNPTMARLLGPYVALSYSRFYPDVTFEAAVAPAALPAAREIVKLCSFLPPEEPERIAALAHSFQGPHWQRPTPPSRPGLRKIPPTILSRRPC